MITQAFLQDRFWLNDLGHLVRRHATYGHAAGSFATGRDRHGYVVMTINKKTYRAHRLVWLYVHGSWPERDIDHINRIKHDNRPTNLRLATKSQNRQNILAHKNNQSGLKGVWLHKQTGKWCASICVNGKNVHLCSRDTKEEAQKSYIRASKYFHEYSIYR